MMKVLRVAARIASALFILCLVFSPIIFLISVGEGSRGLIEHGFRSLVGVPTFAIYLAGVPEATAKAIGPAMLALFAAGFVYTAWDRRAAAKSRAGRS